MSPLEQGKELMQKGVEAKRMNNYSQALEYYEKAKKYIPDEPILYISIAKTCHIMGKYDEAINNYLEGARINITKAENNLLIDSTFREKVEYQVLGGQSIYSIPKNTYHIILLGDLPRHLGHSQINKEKRSGLYAPDYAEMYRQSIIGSGNSQLDMSMEQEIHAVGCDLIRKAIDWNKI